MARSIVVIPLLKILDNFKLRERRFSDMIGNIVYMH
jgi:hypothetical protein